MAVERHQKRGRGRPSLEEVLTTVDEEVALLHDHLGGLPRDVEADEVLHEIWLDDVHNSTAIEGNTMTRAQVAELVERHQASATLVESLEVDRKSTRLNSSHLVISYAVFCLKKKTNEHITTGLTVTELHRAQ